MRSETKLNIRNSILCVIVALQLTGCVNLQDSIQNKLTPTTIYIERENIRLNMPGDNPTGTYLLETIAGEVLAKSNYSPSFNSRGNAGRGIIWFRTELRKISGDTAGSCMRIRGPDNKFVPLQIGFFNTDTSFRIPVIENSVLSGYVVPDLKRKLHSIKNNMKKREELEKKLNSHASYRGNQCIVVTPEYVQNDVCLSREESDKKYSEFCFNSNISCNVGGGALALSLNNKSNGFGNALEILTQNSCSLAVGNSYGQKSDLFSLARSVLVGVTVDNIYEKFIRENPSTEERIALDALAGLINYKFCLSDSFEDCSRRADQWLYRSRKSYKQCKSLEKQLFNTKYFLKYNGGSLNEMEKKLEEYQSRQVEIRKGYKRGRPVFYTEKCG